MTPALDHRSAARILDLADPADASSGPRKAQAMTATVLLFAISAIAAHETVGGGSPTAALGADSFSARAGRAHAAATQESSHMNRLMAVAASGAVAMGSSAFAQDAVQWRVEDGGNGHWYDTYQPPTNISWVTARDYAVSRGGHLVTLTSASEDDFVTTLAVSRPSVWSGPRGPWIGAFGQSPCNLGTACFSWVTDEPMTYARWHPGNPNDILYATSGMCGVLYWEPTWTKAWQDLAFAASQAGGVSAIIEWSADCNSDGLVDYGQIRAGELDDANANNIPDCCEAGTACGCAADISGNGIVDAVDLAAVLSSWGNAPTGKTNADINHDGEVNAIDLAEVLSSWGTCP